jgi:hypothetical protein
MSLHPELHILPGKSSPASGAPGTSHEVSPEPLGNPKNGDSGGGEVGVEIPGGMGSAGREQEASPLGRGGCARRATVPVVVVRLVRGPDGRQQAPPRPIELAGLEQGKTVAADQLGVQEGKRGRQGEGQTQDAGHCRPAVIGRRRPRARCDRGSRVMVARGGSCVRSIQPLVAFFPRRWPSRQTVSGGRSADPGW